MCYSAMIWSDYRKFVRAFGATLSIAEFRKLYLRETGGGNKRAKTPKSMDAAFGAPVTMDEQALHDAIAKADDDEMRSLEEALFNQAKRLANAERVLQARITRTAENEQRVAGNRIVQIKRRIADLKRSDPRPEDSRIYPGYFAPVMVVDGGQRVVKPMRYQCLIAGAPRSFDKKYPGTYNARRDSLGGYWRKQFAHTHGVIVASAFYEHVERDGKNVVLEFSPEGIDRMLVACLWSRWIGADGEDLLSFAAITDHPPPEVAAAGHDRCIIPIKSEHLDAWLSPHGDVATMQEILDDRERPYFEHRKAA